jgi:hypothetical protein
MSEAALSDSTRARFADVGAVRLEILPAPPSSSSTLFLFFWAAFLAAAGVGAAVAEVFERERVPLGANERQDTFSITVGQTIRNGIVMVAQYSLLRTAPRQHPRQPLTTL